MPGGLNDLELETLDEVNLSDSPQLAARPPPAVPARRARRIVSSVALGVTLVLALITWVSLRVDTPPKARAAPDLVSTPPAAADVPVDIQSVSESERRLQEVEMEEVQAPTPREPEDEEPVQAPTPREPEDAEPEIVTPAITRRRLRGGGGESWWRSLSRRLAEAAH